MTAHAAPMPRDPASTVSGRRRFPGRRWVVVWLAFPVAGYIGRGVGGHEAAWIVSSAAGYAAGLAAGAAVVGYETDLGALALMGLVSAAALGIAQGLVLARPGRRALALPWALAMPVLFALGWSVASVTAIRVDDQFTVFGAGGALVFMLLSGLLVARFTPARATAA